MKKITGILVVSLIASVMLLSCGDTGKGGTGPVVGSVYWSPYHRGGDNRWVGPVVYYLHSKQKCFVRASGINNRYGGENIGRIETWELNENGVMIEGHQFEIVGDEVLKSADRVFFKAKSLSEAYNLIYLQTNTSAEN